MVMRGLRTLACMAFLFGTAVAAWGLPCTTSGGCADCFNGEGNEASCITVSYSASCECSISANNRTMCLLKDACEYTGGSSGGGGGGAGGGGGGGCTRSPGGWCPAECSSCGVAYWY